MEGREPKIVVWDLEIIPDLQKALKYWVKLCPPWGGSQTLKADVTSICTFGYKIIGQGTKAKTINAWDFPSWNKNVNDDKALCKAIYDVLHDADALVYQNGDWFDKRHILSRLLMHKLPLLPRIPTIDTKKVAKSNLLMLSNSLDHLTENFTDARKMKHGEGWDLWVDTHNKKKKAMDLMARYCRHDVLATEDLFKALRPFIRNIPNHNLFNTKYAGDKPVCPSCGSTRLHKNGMRHTKTKSYVRYRCYDCGSHSRTDANDLAHRSI